MFEQYPEVLTVKEMAEMLHIGRNSAYDLIKFQKIQAVRVKSQIRIPKESVIRYLRGVALPCPP
jgi:excisionase family DNA binding protein